MSQHSANASPTNVFAARGLSLSSKQIIAQEVRK